MSDNGAVPSRRMDDVDSAVMAERLDNAREEISDHGHRLDRIEQQVGSIALSVTRLVEDSEASRRFTSFVLKGLGIVVSLAGVTITILFNLLGKPHP